MPFPPRYSGWFLPCATELPGGGWGGRDGIEEAVDTGFHLLEHLVRRRTQIGTAELEGSKVKGGGCGRPAREEACTERRVGGEEGQ